VRQLLARADLCPPVQPEQGGTLGQLRRPHEVGPLAGQNTLVVLRECVEQQLGGRVSEDRVAKELEPLVRALLLRRGRRAVTQRSFEDLAILKVVIEGVLELFERIVAIEFHADIVQGKLGVES